MIATPLLLLGAAMGSVADEPFAAHPADAALLFQVPDVQALLRAYEGSVYGRVLADEALHAAVGQLLGAGEPVDPRVLLHQQWAEARRQGDAPPVDQVVAGLRALSLSVSVPNGDIAALSAAMEDLAPSQQEAEAARRITARVVIDFQDADAAALALGLFREAVASNGGELVSAELPSPGGAFGPDGLVRYSPPSGQGALADTLRLFAGGTRLAFVIGAEDDAVALARFGAAGDAPTAATAFAAARAAFEPASGAVVFEAHVEPFVERLLLQQEPMALPALDLAEGLLGPLASMLIRGGDWRLRLVDGVFVTEGSYPKPTSSPLAGLFGARALDAEDLALVTPDAVLAWAVSLDKGVLQRLLAGVLERAGGVDPLAELDAQFGFRPDRDLIAPLGDAIAYSLPPLTTLLSAPPFTVAFDLSDVDAFTRGLDGVFTFLEAQGGDAFQLKREEYKGVRLYSLSFAGADDPSGGIGGLNINPAAIFRPTVAVGQGRAFLITTPNLAKKEVRRVDKLKGELALHPALTAASLPAGATEVGYADWAEVIGRLYSGVKGLAPMLGAVAGELPFDLSQLPDGELITKHFQPSFRSKRLDDGRVRVHARSSFGPEVPLAIAAGAGASATLAPAPVMELEGFDEPPVDVAEEPAPYAGPDAPLLRSRDLVTLIDREARVWTFDRKAPAASLAELGYADAVDGWGRAIVYKVTQGDFRVYSVGPDGVDDGGAGDDILPQR